MAYFIGGLIAGLVIAAICVAMFVVNLCFPQIWATLRKKRQEIS